MFRNNTYQRRIIKYIFVLFIISSFFIGVADAKTVSNTRKKTKTQTVSTTNTLTRARAEAFKNIKYSLSPISYKTELTDKNHIVNLNYINQQINQSGDESRLLFPYFLGETLISYGVKYSTKPNEIFFYNSQGTLIRIEISEDTDKYPHRTFTYNNKGKLHTVVLYISKTEQYNFDGEGNLVVHWIGERGFNKYGKPIKIKRTL